MKSEELLGQCKPELGCLKEGNKLMEVKKWQGKDFEMNFW
jgi:hypothetical protein